MTVEESKAVVVIDKGYSLPEKSQLKRDLIDINEFQAIVHANLIIDVDYGTIPGTNKPTLYKPGAEKIVKLLRLSDRYEILPASIENWDKPFFYYQIKCVLTYEATGEVVSEGLGSCNSYEDKYRYRWLWGSEVPSTMDKSKMVTKRTKKGAILYRTDNEEIFTIVNTLLKMAKKRALIDAALSAGRLSNAFTQDLEDIKAKLDNDDDPDVVDGEAANELPDLGKCPECGKDLVTRSSNWGDFIACSGYPKCKYKLSKNKDENKDKDESHQDAEKTPELASKPKESNTPDGAPGGTPTELENYHDLLKELAASIWGEKYAPKWKEWLKENFGFNSSKEITVAKRQAVYDRLQAVADLKK